MSKAWSNAEVKALAERAFLQAEKHKERNAIVALLKPMVAKSRFWIATRYARFDKVRLSTISEWIEEFPDTKAEGVKP